MVEVRELAPAGAINLRVDPRNSAALQAVAENLGAPLPAANTWVTAGTTHVLWQAYDEWLFVTPERQQHALASALRDALGGTHHALTDVSDLRVVFLLEGANARDVLQKGCAVDLHPRAFGEHACVTAALARVRATLRRTGLDAFEIFVERSYGEYLRDWLLDAALEYGQAMPTK